jgi:two-component system, chemotaxis family, CheB/CheR fusion protein
MDKRELSPPVAVVGIGASAGGLEAFISLLKALSPDTGMAFVLIFTFNARTEEYFG